MAKRKQSKPYPRKDSQFLWFTYYDLQGKRCLKSAETADMEEAKTIQNLFRDRIAAEKRAGLKSPDAPTFRWYAEEKWLPARRARGVRSVGDDAFRLRHAMPFLGDRLLKDITAADLQLVINAVVAKGLSQRLEHHVYGAMRVLFRRAMKDGLIKVSPCVLTVRDGDLRRKQDKNPHWRGRAVYTRAEVERLLSDERIPEYRRVLWALLFVGGLRVNEATPRRWEDFDPEAEPLGQLNVVSHLDVKLRQDIPGTKNTPHPRPVPVHPTLATMLARWKMLGWPAMVGRTPRPDDLIIEAPRGGMLNSNRTLEALKEDCQALGIRVRGQHDMRRTFVSLTLAGGANKDKLRFVSHGATIEEAIDGYNIPPWYSLCEQVSFLKVGLLEGRVSKLPATLLLRSEK